MFLEVLTKMKKEKEQEEVFKLSRNSRLESIL